VTPSSPSGQRPPLSANSSYGQQQQQQQYQSYQPPQQQPQHPYPSQQTGRPSISSITSTTTTGTGAGRPSLDDGRRPSSNASFYSSSHAHQPPGGSNGGGGRPSLSSPTPAFEIDGSGAPGGGGGYSALGFGQPGPSSATTLVGGAGGAGSSAVPVQFDEGVLRQLCELDCAMPLLDSRIKQSLASCKQVSVFLRARAKVEEGYARSLGEMGRDLMDQYARSEGKAGCVASLLVRCGTRHAPRY
jgi:hypothetical protein